MTVKQEIQARVAKHFDGDTKKIRLWWNVKNPLLGEMPPRIFARRVGWDKLLLHVKNWQEGNIP